MTRNYKKLIVWEKAHKLTISIYKICNLFPKHEKYGLVSQLQRASSSIPTYLAEGSARSSLREYLHFINIASGSAAEVEYLLQLSIDLGYLERENTRQYLNKIIEIRKMLYALHKNLKPRA